MKKRKFYFFNFYLFIPLFTVFFLLLNITDSFALKAGAVKAEITPDLGIPLNGYGARLGKGARAVHDPLWAHVLYISDDETELFLVSLDLCLVDRELRDKVISMAPENFPPQNIIMTVTHTHNGFGGMCKQYPLRFISGRYIPELVERTARIISQALRDAKANAKNAVLGYGTIPQEDLTCNRRYSGGPRDSQIGFIAIEDANGSEIAIIANMAGHPTSVDTEGDDLYSFSADYPGYFYLEIESLAAAGCVPFFLNGAEGNQTIQAPEQTSGWARTEKVGRLLAQRVYEAQKNISLSEAKLKLIAQEIALPMSIMEFFPQKTLFQSLQINDLAISFFPGELCVEYALQLREHVLGAGFKAHFTVDLANDYLMYFVPPHLLFDKTYEAGMNFFGPQAEKWVLNTCLSLLNIEKPEFQNKDFDMPEVQKTEQNLSIVKLVGTPYECGFARGKFAKNIIQKRFEELIQQPTQKGKYLSQQGMASIIPAAWVDMSTLLLPTMAIGIRPTIKKLHQEVIDELIGVSDGTSIPFDKIWLLQNTMNIQQAQSFDPLFDTPLCTAVTISGERAGAKDILIGHTVDWEIDELPVVFSYKPANGIPFVEIGFTWFNGTFCGMNEAGIVLSITRDTGTLTDLSKDVPGPEFTLKHVLLNCANIETAISEVANITIPPSYHIILAGKNNEGKWMTYVFPEPDPNDATAQTLKSEGILLGCASLSGASETTAKRYSNLLRQLENERIVSPDELKTMMTTTNSEDTSLSQLWNEHSRFNVVFEPTEKKVSISIRTNDNKPSEYFSLEIGNI